MGVLLLGGLTFSAADAATPDSGTVSDQSTTREWTGGPFVTPNVTGSATGQPTCDLPESCDDYALTVDTPAGYGDTHQLSVKVSWPNAAADFDVYLLDEQGNEVSTAASTTDPETILTAPTSGNYTVRVVPYAPLGQSYTAEASLVQKPANPEPGTDPAPGFTNYAAPSRLPDSNNAGEPSIGTNFNTDATFYQAYLSTYKVTFDDSTSPAKATWSDASANAANGCVVGSTVSLDPILFTDHETGRTLESQLTGANSFTCYTDDDGQTWLPSTGGGIPSGVDHQTIGGGGPFAEDGVGGTGLYPNAVYYCSQDIATAFCAISRDGGVTFGPGVPTYSLLECGGLHGHITVGPEGTAYLPNKGCGDTAGLVTSTDNGATWTVNHVPGSTPSDADPSVGTGANGTVYFGYVGADGVPGVATSHDHGTTFENQQTVGGEFAIKNAVFPTMVAGDDDRASFAYLGTPTGGNYQDTENFKGVWHLYVTTSYDGGKTWVTTDATPNDPVQRGSICTGGTTCGDDRNLLDFIGSTIDDHGRVEVAYADGCIDACVTNPSKNNHDAYATIARQSSGKPLFAKFDPQPNLTVFELSVRKTRKGRRTATIEVTNNGKTGAQGVVTGIRDGNTPVGTTQPDTVAAGQSVTQTLTWRHKGKKRPVTAVVDPQNTVAESDEGDNKRTVKSP